MSLQKLDQFTLHRMLLGAFNSAHYIPYTTVAKMLFLR